MCIRYYNRRRSIGVHFEIFFKQTLNVCNAYKICRSCDCEQRFSYLYFIRTLSNQLVSTTEAPSRCREIARRWRMQPFEIRLNSTDNSEAIRPQPTTDHAPQTPCAGTLISSHQITYAPYAHVRRHTFLYKRKFTDRYMIEFNWARFLCRFCK